MNSSYGELFIILFVLIIIFIITREFWCWYWKINKRVALLEDIKSLLEKLVPEQSEPIADNLSKENHNQEVVNKPSSQPKESNLSPKEIEEQFYKRIKE